MSATDEKQKEATPEELTVPGSKEAKKAEREMKKAFDWASARRPNWMHRRAGQVTAKMVS